MLNSILKTAAKLAVLFALVKFVILPMIPGSFDFTGFHFPSMQDFLKDPLKFGKEVFAQLPKLPAPDLGQAGRDADRARLEAQDRAKHDINSVTPSWGPKL